MNSRKIPLPRPSLSAQVNLFILGLTLALAITVGVAWLNAGEQAIRRTQAEIEDGLQHFQSDYNRANGDLNSLGNRLIGQKELIDLIQTSDGPGLTQFLSPWTEINIADSIMVTDPNGNVLVDLSPGPTPTPKENVRELSLVSEALLGKRSTALTEDKNRRLKGQLGLPVFAPGGPAPIGTIILGFYLDGSFLRYRARQLDQEIGTLVNGRLSILTLTDQQGNAWQIANPPDLLLQAQREGHSSEYMTLETGVGQYLFRFKPFEVASTSKGGMYGIGVSLGSIDTERLNLFRTVGLGISIIAIGAGLLGLLFTRALTRPIRMLDAAAQSIAQGDLSRPIGLARDDELGDLARQMESMRLQLRRAFESAVLEKSRYAAVIRSMGAAAVVTDHTLTIVAVNPAAETLLRASESRLLGAPWDAIFMDGRNENLPSRWDPGSELDGEHGMALRRRFGVRTRPQMTVDVISTQVQVEGAPAGYVHILQDASAQEQLLRAQDEFIMNAAHELRGPLSSLRASIELLLEDYAVMPKGEMGIMLRTLQRATVKFQGLVENILDMGNIQARRFRVRPATARVDAMIADALTQVGPLLTGRGQTAQVKIECPTPCLVMADRPRIVQVLINLITNASKYGPEDQGIDLHAFPDGESVVFEVTDQGPGIPPEEQPHLFQRFYRGRRAQEEGIGIGLGLALAREIIEAHRGQMDVKSGLGQGTTFWFSLPQAAQDSSRPSAETRKDQGGSP